MVYFKEIYKFVCFQAGRGVVQNFQRVQLLIPMATYKTCDFPGRRGPDPLSLFGSAHDPSLKLYYHSHTYVFFTLGGI